MDSNREKETQMSKDWKCIICKRMLINAHNGPCGCRYCWECVNKYLNGANEFCPGNFEDCGVEKLDLYGNISIDQAVNIQISRIIVKCPERPCQYEGELRVMRNHMNLSHSSSSECPYSQFGCSSPSNANDNINEHLQEEFLSHSKSLCNWVYNLKSEIGTLKADMSTMLSDNKNLKIKIDQLSAEIENKIIEIRELKNNDFKKNKEILTLQRKLKHMEEELVVLNQNLPNRTGRYPKMVFNLGIIIIISMIVLMGFQINSIQYNLVELDRGLGNNQRNYGYFHWEIKDFTSHKTIAEKEIIKTIYSDPFFTHEKGYKISLALMPNGDNSTKGEHMSIYFTIMRGPFDEELPWPMGHHLIVELINQKTGLVHKKHTIQSDENPQIPELQKPKSYRNNGFGNRKFIRLSELLKIEGLIMKDKLILRCTIKLI